MFPFEMLVYAKLSASLLLRGIKYYKSDGTFREYSVMKLEVAGHWRVVETSNNVDNEVENSHRFVLLPYISLAKLRSNPNKCHQ